MFKWKIKFYVSMILLININCQLEQENNIAIEIEPKEVKIIYLNFKKRNKISFKNITEEDDLLVNFRSIDCDFRIIIKNNENNIVKNNIFSILLQNIELNNERLYIEPIISSGNLDKNNEFKTCPLVINSVYKNKYKLNIEKKVYMAFNFNENLPYIVLSYKIKNLNDGFTTLSFIPDGNYIFDVIINNNEIKKNISNSSNIFLENSKLNNNKLTIKITLNNQNKLGANYESVLIFKLIESNSTSLLEKNNLNLGFTYSKKDNQYYYLEIFKGEEGEIMIHNKRLFGELYGFIKPKLDVNDVLKPENYEKNDNNNKLQFDALTLKLSFKSYQTEQCEEGCYLLVRYSHDDYYSFCNNSIVGFEYTLLVRVWDEEETGSHIINIPFNEYIFGAFEKGSIYHHYYSLYIPKDTKEIIIQFEGNYIDGYIGSGKKKLNTFRELNNTQNLNLTENKMIIKYNKTQLNKLNVTDIISLAFRSKNYFENIFSYYYFRILLNDKNDTIYPLDSNIGSFCAPQKEGEKYLCSCILKNDYNEYSLKHSISTSNKRDKLTYNYLEVLNGKIEGDKKNNYILPTRFDKNDPLVQFKFENEKIGNILSILSINYNEMYPQIYSKQIYYLKNYHKNYTFDLKRKYSLTLNYIRGEGVIEYSGKILNVNENFRGKPFFFPLNEKDNYIYFKCDGELIFYTQIDEINEIKELSLDETLREIIPDAKRLPIYYYIKTGENEINQIDVHYRIKVLYNTNINRQIFFKIYGYILSEKEFKQKRNINGKFIDLNNPYRGTYDTSFRIGILNFNKTNSQADYIVLKIESSYDFTNEEILLELLAMSKKNDNYILPINSFIIDTYNLTGKNYTIIIEDKDNGKDKDQNDISILVEFIPDNNQMTIKGNNNIKMDKISNENGILQRYRITNLTDDFILRVEAPKDISFGNYILRYYFTEKVDEEYYKLNKEFKKIKGNKNDIILEFNELELISNKNKTTKEGIAQKNNSFFIYGYLYLEEINIKSEFIDSSFLYNQKKILKNISYIEKNSKFSLYFNNIKNLFDDNEIKKYNYVFNLYIKIFVFQKDVFKEEIYLYNIPINLEDEFKDKNDNWELIIVSASLGFVIITILIITIIIVIKLKKNNTNLKEKVLAISFTSGKIDDEIEEKKNCKNDEDYENTFI